jgi:hypothetical protein
MIFKLVLTPSDHYTAAPVGASKSTEETLLPHAHRSIHGELRKLCTRGGDGDPISQPENWGSTPIRAPSAIVPFCTPPYVTSLLTQRLNTV